MGTKRAIPWATRRAVAHRHGAAPTGTVDTSCVYCGGPGRVHWMTPGWVYFEGLELDHVLPESLGGGDGPDNIVLACRRCNRSKGARIVEVPRG